MGSLVTVKILFKASMNDTALMHNYGLLYTANTGLDDDSCVHMSSTDYSQPYWGTQPSDLCLTYFYSTCTYCN